MTRRRRPLASTPHIPTSGLLAVDRNPGSLATSLPQVTLRLEGTQLVVPPFRIECFKQRFVQDREQRIDLTVLAPDIYRVLAVQNFWIEDHNPELRDCVAAVFLARRRADGQWEEPENWPIECRTLAHLGYVETRRPDRMVLPRRDHEY